MSSITTTTTRTRLRVTARGRHVAAVLVALPVCAALGAAVLSGGAAAASREAVDATSFETVTVGAGDSLWSIAQDVAPHADPRDVVDDILRLNALSSVTVASGQKLAIPLEYTPE